MTAHLTRVRSHLAIHAHRKVRGLLDGEYAAVQTGRSMDFNDLREYVRGDDVKDVDWKASARARSLLVKRYVAVRKHTVLVVVSTGRSMAAQADPVATKRDLAVLVAGAVGWLALRHGDRVALAWGDASRQQSVPPTGGEVGLERALTAVHDATTVGAAPSSTTAVLDHVARTVRRRTILLVVSDERDLDDEAERVLRRLAVQHEVLWCSIGDLDPTGDASLTLRDLDGGGVLGTWWRDDPALQREVAATSTDDRQRLGRTLDRVGIVHETVPDEASAVRAALRLLERHRHARRR